MEIRPRVTKKSFTNLGQLFFCSMLFRQRVRIIILSVSASFAIIGRAFEHGMLILYSFVVYCAFCLTKILEKESFIVSEKRCLIALVLKANLSSQMLPCVLRPSVQLQLKKDASRLLLKIVHGLLGDFTEEDYLFSISSHRDDLISGYHEAVAIMLSVSRG